MRAGNQTLLKKNNQRAIRDYIIENGPISRADLSKVLKISKPTVSANVNELMEMELLLEIGYSETDIGKKPMLVDFNKNYEYILALDFISYISKNIVTVAVCNLYCEIIFTDSIDLGENFSPETMERDFPKDLLSLFKVNKIPLSKIGIVVLTAPTAIYDKDNIRFECGNGDIINLAEIINKNIDKEILVKNDINLAALGEKYFGVGKKVNNLIFIWAGLAVGGGIILNGELYEGINNGGGELAYSTVFDEITGKYVFIKDVLSYSGIKNYINHFSNEAKNSSISDKLFEKKLNIDDIITAAHNGDKFCRDFATYIAKTMTAIICNLSGSLDLEMAIIGGEYGRFGHLFTDEIVKRIEKMPITHTQILTPMYGNSAMYGAFKIGADAIINSLI